MINLGNGTVYLQKGEPVPLGCPECHAPVPYSEEQIVTCRECGYADEQDAFEYVAWKLAPIN